MPEYAKHQCFYTIFVILIRYINTKLLKSCSKNQKLLEVAKFGKSCSKRQKFLKNCRAQSVRAYQGPHSQILMTGRSDRTSEFVYPKKSLLFLAYPKKSLGPFFATQKNPCFFFATPKNPSVFHRPKKITFGQNFRPQKITQALRL